MLIRGFSEKWLWFLEIFLVVSSMIVYYIENNRVKKRGIDSSIPRNF